MNKIILLELDQQLEQDLFYTAAGLSDGVTTLSPGIYRFRTTITGAAFSADFLSSDFSGVDDPFNRVKYQVGSFTIDNTDYTEVSDFADLEAQNQSFLWDGATQTVYVHFNNREPWYSFGIVSIGYVLGFSRTSGESGYTTETGVFYQPALIDAPVLSQSADPLFFGVIEESTITARLSNGERFSLDDIATRVLFGAPCRMKVGNTTDDFADFVTVFTGRVRNIPKVAESEVSLQLQSDRAFLSKKLPIESYNQATYPNLNDNDLGKPVPLIFGVVRNVNAVNIDQEESPAPINYTYKVATTDLNGTTYNLQSIDAVYVDGVAKTPVSTSPTTGTFEMAGTDVKDGTSFLEVTADVTGYSNDNALEVIRVLLDEFNDQEFIAANYNLAEWGSAESQVADIGIVIGHSERESIKTVIEKISASVLGNFIIEGDGKYTFRFPDEDRLPKYYIQRRMQNAPPVIEYNSEEYLTTATAKYSRNWSAGRWRRYEDDSVETEVLARYRVDRNKEFDTLLTNEADAQEFAQSIMADSQIVPPRFPVQVNLVEFEDLLLFDNIYLEVNREDREFYGTLYGVITEIRKDYNEEIIDLEVRWKSDATIEDGIVTSDFLILDAGDSSTSYDLLVANGDAETQYTGFTIEGDANG